MVAIPNWIDRIKALFTGDKLIVCGLIHLPVSYTHLDVYKRQALHRGEEEILQNAGQIRPEHGGNWAGRPPALLKK